jgi:hypothetical protein
LNSDFTDEEVVDAIKRLHSGRVPGPDGLRAEFIKNAYISMDIGSSVVKDYVLAPVLRQIYQSLFSQGHYVRDWSSASLSAVFKKGDATCLDNYRAIAVGAVMGKLYAVLLDCRMSSCAEKSGWRAEGQAGFRAGKSTVDHVFVLRHLIERTQLSTSPDSGPMFCCFVDFRKAYDKVRRDFLMERLAKLGVHGNMLQAVMQMYWSVPLVPKLDGQFGPAIDSTCGVKQGDPLSPLLFGLFIDEFEGWLREKLPEAGVTMGDKLVQMLLYADDMALLAPTAEILQQQLDLLHQFCVAREMEVNVSKTEIVVFRKEGQAMEPEWQWQYNGQAVQISAEFRYLGIILHETQGVLGAIESLTTAARRAMWAMLGRFRVARISDISMKLAMYKALVLPIMEYCGEVWGPSLVFTAKELRQIWDNPMQRVQNLFLRQMGHLRKSVATGVLHRELCMEPVMKGWVRASRALWERIRAAPRDSLLGAALRDSLQLARSSLACRKKTWSGQFMSMLDNLFADRDPSGVISSFVTQWGISASDELLPLPLPAMWDAWDYLLNEGWEEVDGLDPRQALSDQVRLATYRQWFATPPPSLKERLRQATFPLTCPNILGTRVASPLNM